MIVSENARTGAGATVALRGFDSRNWSLTAFAAFNLDLLPKN
jgi:hypothetical protein